MNKIKIENQKFTISSIMTENIPKRYISSNQIRIRILSAKTLNLVFFSIEIVSRCHFSESNGSFNCLISIREIEDELKSTVIQLIVIVCWHQKKKIQSRYLQPDCCCTHLFFIFRSAKVINTDRWAFFLLLYWYSRL